MNPLAQSIDLPCKIKINNRFLKSAMSENLGSFDNNPSQDLVQLYTTWAKGGTGILVTGNVMVDRLHLGEPKNVVLDETSNLNLFKKWSSSVKGSESKIWIQLNHPGRQSPAMINKSPVAPSAIAMNKGLQAMFRPPRALSSNEVSEVVQKYILAAKLAKESGFDGVQIHGAHGYLVSQFLSPLTNQREDEWGGNFEKRFKFVKEIYLGMREACGDDFPIGIKINSADFQKGGFSFDDSIQVAKKLAELGIDLIEISGGSYEKPSMMGVNMRESTQKREAYFSEFTKELKQKIPNIPLVLTGGFLTSEGMKEAVTSKTCDFVGVARSLAMDPFYPKAVLNGADFKSEVKPRTLGIKALDQAALLEIYWYTQQLARMGKGKMPKVNRHPWTSLALAILTSGRDIFQKQRAK